MTLDRTTFGWLTTGLVVLLLTLTWTSPVLAHCDALDGPVVQTARQALETGDVTPILKWVRDEDEAEVREAFRLALAVRGQGDDARELADRYWLETVVRVHREGEGAPYTGLKPAGTIPPCLTAADRALETGSVDELAEHLAQEVAANVRARFRTAHEKKQHAGENVEAGRAFVEAYVGYIHFVEGIHQVVSAGEDHHPGEHPEHLAQAELPESER